MIYKYRNLIDIAQRVSFKDVKRALKYYYPDTNKEIMERYKEIMEEISKYKEKKNKEWSISISILRPYKFYSKECKKWLELTEIGEESYDVCGKKKGDKVFWAIEFTRWEEVANYKIEERTLKAYKPAEIMAHFLYEITFVNFEQESIQKELKQLKKDCKTIKEKTKRNKKKN